MWNHWFCIFNVRFLLYLIKVVKLRPLLLPYSHSVSHPKATEVARRAGWSFLRLMISTCHNKLNCIKYAIREIQQEKRCFIPEYRFCHTNGWLCHLTSKPSGGKQNSYKARTKTKRCDPTVNNNRHKEINKRWVVNASDCDQEAHEISLLRKGVNFAITPRSVVVKEILTAVEQEISNLLCTFFKRARYKHSYIYVKTIYKA